MRRPNPIPSPIWAATAIAAALMLASCHSAGAANAQANSNMTVLKRGPAGNPSLVRIDGRDWPVCGKESTDKCIDPRPAGLA